MKTRMKREIMFIITLCMMLSLSACNGKYKLKADNDAVLAVQEQVFEKVEAGCKAENYNMDLFLDVSENTVSGVAEVEVLNQSKGDLDEVCFRYFAPALTEESNIRTIKNAETGKEYGFETEVNDTFIRVPLGETLADQEKIIFEIDFISYIPEIEERFGFVTVANKKIYNMCFCFPQIAFLDNGAWANSEYVAAGESTYNEMSDYYVTFTAPEDYVVLSSGKSVTEGKVTRIEAENVREMAITACNFAEVETKQVNGITFNMLKPAYEYTNEKYLDDLYELILECAIESTEMFSSTVGEYIYDELDIIPTPFSESIGGMEMPGLVQISVRAYQDESIFENCEDYLIEEMIHVISHEVGHQWFCQAVGNDQYYEPWIDESFASYLEYYYCRGTRSAYKLYDEMASTYFGYNKGEVIMSTWNYMEDEYLCINYPIDKYSEKDYGCVYSCGEAFLRSLEKQMGKDRFLEMLSDWYENNKNGIAEGYAFVQHVLEYDESEEVKVIINSYISEKYLK